MTARLKAPARDAPANGKATEGSRAKTSKRKPPPHRGVAQRNAGLAFARDRERLRAAIDEGRLFGGNTAELVELAKRPWDDPLVYFGDDDNEYDPRVFEEMAKIKKAGVWPVGFPFAMAPTHVEAPAVDDSGSVVGFYSKFCDKRRYNVDMAGFALRVSAARRHARRIWSRFAQLPLPQLHCAKAKCAQYDVRCAYFGCSGCCGS